MTLPKRWYQLSMLQIMLVTAVLAVFIFKNWSTIEKTFPDGTWSSEQGWPLARFVRSGRSMDRLDGQFSFFMSVEYAPKERNWAHYANIVFCGLACMTTAYAVTFISRRLSIRSTSISQP